MIDKYVKPTAVKLTDGHAGYKGLSNHKVVQHNIGEWVNQNSHTNGIESVWAMFSRGFHGVYHRMSIQHLHRYAQEFQGRHNERDEDTIVQMEKLVEGFAGERLTYKELIALKGDAIPVVTIEVGGGEDWLPDFDKALEEWETFLKARTETARQSSTRRHCPRRAAAADDEGDVPSRRSRRKTCRRPNFTKGDPRWSVRQVRNHCLRESFCPQGTYILSLQF